MDEVEREVEGEVPGWCRLSPEDYRAVVQRVDVAPPLPERSLAGLRRLVVESRREGGA